MKPLGPALVASLACCATLFTAPLPARAAGDCKAFRVHVARAQAALIEADAYLTENKREPTMAQAEIATHELDVARAYGNATTCYGKDKRAVMDYAVAEIHMAAYRADELPTEQLLEDDVVMQQALRTNAALQKKINPEARAALLRYAKAFHDVAERARRRQRDDVPPHDRTEAVAQAIRKCEAAKASQPAYGIDLPVPGGTGMGGGSYYTATLDVDDLGRPDNVQVFRVVTDRNVAVDTRPLRFSLQNALYGPATVYEAGRCSAVGSSVTIESGKIQ